MSGETESYLQTDWDIEKVRNECCVGLAFQYAATIRLLRQFGADAIREFNKIFIANKDYFIHREVNNPLRLVSLLAQFEANVFGSKMQVWGDETTASIAYAQTAEWIAVEQLGELTDEERAAITEHFVYAMQDLAAEFNFKVEVTFTESNIVVTFIGPPPSLLADGAQPR